MNFRTSRCDVTVNASVKGTSLSLGLILSMLLLTSTLLAEMTSLTFDFAGYAILYKEVQRTKYHYLCFFRCFWCDFRLESGKMQE